MMRLVKRSLSFLFFFLFSIIIFNLWILNSRSSAESNNEFESNNLIKNNFNQTKIFKLNSSTTKHRRSVSNDEILINKPIFATHKRFNKQAEFNLDNEEQNNIKEENELFSDSEEEDDDDGQLSGSGYDETEEPNNIRLPTESSIINNKQNSSNNNVFQNINNFVFTSPKQDLKVIQIHNCLDTEFKCSDGSDCLESSKKCNGFKDCNDGSDELNCDTECGSNMFKCSPNHCIPISKRCDNKIDCETGKDEIDCVPICNPTFEFQCKHTQNCVNIRQVCDGQNDCLDGSDELNCKCKKNEFQCENKRHCIKNELKCNGNWDCIDGSDEANCSCALNEFRCNNGQCITLNKRCNNIIDCQDQSDEINCEVQKNCKSNEFECSATKRCIDIEKRCDSYFDCEDYSDELNCDKEKCKNDEFTCRNKKCIAKIFVCDKISDCTDGSDEDFCWKSPIKKNFHENNLKLLTKFSNLKELKVYPNYQTVKVGFTAVLRCRDESINRLPITWYKVLNKNLINSNLDYLNDLKIIELKKSENIEIRGGRLTFKKIDLNDQGLYLCKTRLSSTPSYLSVEQEEENFLSSNDFMLNDAPEINSNEASSSSLCGYSEFACGNSNQCIPRSFLCDNHNDCLDNSDEIGCSPPMIVQTTEKQIIVSEGDNTTMYCKAIGTPTPVITWKYNWKTINNNDRFTTSSKNGLGLLQISNVQQNDNGRYICMARNNLDTTTAPFDFELIIKSKSGVCLPPTFYDDAKTQDQCIKCFCFNLTSTCYSSNLKIQSIPLSSRLSYVFLVFDNSRNEYRELPSYLYNQNKLIFNKGNEQTILNSSILDSNTNNPETVIYWSLPNLFTGNLIKSYGGFIRYYFQYIVPFHHNKIKEADIIIKNEHNNLVAYHNYDLDHAPLIDNQIQLRLTENHFTKERSTDRISQHVFNREEFLTLLQNVTHFYIRAKFDQSFIESKILSIEIDSAVEDLIDSSTNQRIAKLVEKCSCPTGYQGTSCESCAPGYNRRTSFHYGFGSCVKEASNCRCNGNSYQCDSLNRCFNCQNNTEGYNCEKCKRSFYGDPARGIPCRKCNCPDLSTGDSNETESNEIDQEWSSGHCVLENDGLPSCVTCPLGTEGRRCEFCAPNYVHDSEGKCRIRQQVCSNNTEGYKCEKCVKGYFGYPSRGMPCQKCECQKISSEIYKRMCFIDGKELNCKANCADNEYKCKNGNCIPISSYCDGYLDCADETDENNCPTSPCNPIGSYTSYYKTRNNKCDCKPSVIGDKCDTCDKNSFNFSDQGCTKCYCMGVSNNCEAKDVTRYRLNLNPNLKNLNLTTIDNINIEEEDGSLELKELDTENSIPFMIYKQNPIKKKPTTIFYWRLPKEFLGNKIGSYGSKISYKIIYKHLNDDEEISYNPDLILASNHEELHFKQKKKIESEKLTKIEIIINENNFLDARGQPIRKNQLMNVLHNLDKILIKASYTRDIIFTGIKEIKFEIDQITKSEIESKLNENLLIDQSIQAQIESCKCPTGYTGNSCEKCSDGYYKKPGYYHQCIPCDCNGNSNKCDALTGKCIDCQYNTEGDNCEKCQNGFTFSRTRGFMECIESIEIKFNQETYNSCNCKVDGVLSLTCDPSDNRCYCKDNVEGGSCHRCKAGFYNLNKNNPYGCTECSCSGVTKKCRENYSYLTLLGTDNKDSSLNSLKLKDKDDRLIFIQEVEFDSGNNEFSFKKFDLVNDRTLYWHLPSKFLGNKLKAYGYNLSYEINFSPDQGILIADPDVVIKGKNLTIIYTAELSATQNKKFEIPLEEKYWEKIDMNKKISKIKKDEFLKVLTFINDIAIRAVYREDQKVTSIKNLTLETTTDNAVNKNDEKVLTSVEQCLCPIGYEGSSCETCSFGYARSKYGLCLKCDCNGHSNNCYFTDENEQICSDCLHDTKGKQCEFCSAGFYGDARLKTPSACKPCLCPSIKPMNNYAETCSQELNGQIMCHNCQEGYSGNNCEKCSSGFEKIVNAEGFKCIPQINLFTNKTLEQRIKNHQSTHSSRIYQDTIISSSTTRLRLDPNHLSQIVASGQTASLRCVAQSITKNELLPIEWSKEKENLPKNSRQYQGILEISNVKIEDAGTYVCLVKDSDGTFLKLKAHLQVDNQKQNEYSSTEQKSRIEPRVLNVEIGEPVMLKCLVQSSKPFEVKWFKTSQSNELVPETRVINDALVINEANPMDSGDYYCQVKTDSDQQMVRSRVIVTKKSSHVADVPDPYFNSRNMNQPLDVTVAPTVHITPEKQTLVQGKDGELKCIATGNPKPTITWIKAHSQLSPRHIIKNIDSSSNSITSVLEILDSVVEDRGLYVCRAESSGGMVQQSAIVEIERREIPAIEIYPSSVQNLQVDSSALFQCRITAGIPSPTIEWRKSDGKIINPSNDNGIEILSGGVIRFNSLKTDQQGKYICSAYNLAGRVNAEAELNVIGSIQVKIRQTSPYRIREGDRVKLDCELIGQSSGFPQYRIEWRKTVINSQNNYAQLQIPYISAEPNTASLIINQVSSDDSGSYLCLGFSAQSNEVLVQERIQLIVEKPEMSSLTSSHHTLQVEDRVIRAQLNAPVQIRCFVRKVLENIKLNWLKLDSNLPINSRVEDGVLYIEKVLPEDDGVYVCTGFNEKTKSVAYTEKIRLAVVGFYGKGSPKIALMPLMQSAKAGDQIKVQCQVLSGGNSRVHWTKLIGNNRQPIKVIGNQDAMLSVRNHFMQERIKQINDTLIIDNATYDDQGNYLCTVISAGGTAEAVAEILVTEHDNSSRMLKASRTENVVAGQTVVLKCPLKHNYSTIKWSADQKPLPDNAIANYYELTLTDVTSQNEGRYICAAYDDKNSMVDRDYVVLTVKDLAQDCSIYEFKCNDGTCIPKSARCNSKYDCSDLSDENNCGTFDRENNLRITNNNEDVEIGGTLILECTGLKNSQQKPVKWLKMNGNESTDEFLDNVIIENNKLKIQNIKVENGGVYRCIIDEYPRNVFTDNVVTVKVQAKSAPFGTNIIMHCKSNAINNVQNYHWKKQDSPLPENALARGSVLTIRNLNENNADIYTCIARNSTHRVEIPTILRVTNIIPLFNTDSFIGIKTAFFNYKKNEIELSVKFKTLDDSLILFRSKNSFQALNDPNFLTTVDDSFQNDFIALIISNKHLEAKFELGNGVVTLKSHNKLKIDVWHHIKFKKHHKRALLEISDQPEVEHISNGQSVGLNLDSFWYIGGFPNFTILKYLSNKHLKIDKGIHGCISIMKLDNKNYNLMKSLKYSKNILSCDTCNVREQQIEIFQKLIDLQQKNQKIFKNFYTISNGIHQLNEQLFNLSSLVNLPNSTCRNNGICQEALTKKGMKCICNSGFSGQFCEKNSEQCFPGYCGLGKCIDLKKIKQSRLYNSKNHLSYICDCPLGKTGDRCSSNITITQPRFTGERSYISYPIFKESSSQILIVVKLKLTVYQPNNLIRDSLVWYSAEKSNGNGDFISLIIKNQKFVFIYNTGSGITKIESQPLSNLTSKWIMVKVLRIGGEGRLSIALSGEFNDIEKTDLEYVGYSPGNTKGINLRLPLYFGDVDEQLVTLPSILKDLNGFVGCVNKINVNNYTINLLNHLIDSSNIKECGSKSSCFNKPCKNNGVCSEIVNADSKSNISYKCICRQPFSGLHCEINNGICAKSKPCQNKGKCIDASSNVYFNGSFEFSKTNKNSGYRCCCQMGYTGTTCEIIEEIKDPYCAYFETSSYFVINKKVFSQNSSETEQVIELTFETQSFNGLIFYQGDMNFLNKDYLMISLVDGFLEITWQLGSGPGFIKSEESLNDGRSHQIIFKRKGQEGQLIVDILNPIFGKSGKGLTQLNVDNDIYIGGFKNIEFFNKIKPSIVGFSGTISNIKIDNSINISFNKNLRSSCNIRPCSSKIF